MFTTSIIQCIENTINKMSDVNNLSHNEEHPNVSKVYQIFSTKRKYGQSKMNPDALGRQDHAHSWVLFKCYMAK